MADNRISVRDLVEFIFRSGDIDNRSGSAEKEAMQMGSKMHRKIQRSMGSSYHAEQTLKIEVPIHDTTLLIEGRADGIIKEEDVTIDEIKGMFRDVASFKEPYFVHKAQAMCYAYIYAKEQDLSSIYVQMTYCNLETEDIRRFREEYSFLYLEQWFDGLVREYEKWVIFQSEWKKERNASIKELEFPFSYRKGQKDLVTYAYRTFYHRKKMFIQAPTGVGKTMSTVFPAVKAVGEGLGDKIFYLTAKTITRTVAKEAFETLGEHGLCCKVVTITAKEKICPCEEKECNPDACPYAKGHYDRVNQAVYEMLQQDSAFTREVIEAAAETYQVCPYELSLDISTWVDAVICDYNYVFDPTAHLKRFFGEGVKGEYLFLIDEAHNLIERGREMYSAVLYKEMFLEVRKLVKDYNRRLYNILGKCNKYLLDLKRECETYVELTEIGPFSIYILNLIGELEKFLEQQDPGKLRKAVLEFYLEVYHFLSIYEQMDENYVIYTEHERDGRFKIKLFCIDTAVNLQKCLDKGNSTIYFSATLLPVHYYQSLLSNEKDDYAVYCESPFEKEQKCLLIASDVSSKYTRRSLQEYDKIASYIQQTLQIHPGNYMVFFPSYQLMMQVWESFERIREEDTVCLLQRQGMSEQEREVFIQTFKETKEISLVGFCVMGGIFGEGIDLTEETLIGAMIVGTGLPQVCNEREILKKYYDKKGMDGFAYAYLYPGMNKVLQSAGRVIRTHSDRGVILLLDERFRQNQYQYLFPKEWYPHDICSLQNVSDKLQVFWGSTQEADELSGGRRNG